MDEGFGQRLAARDDVREIRKINRVGRMLGLIADGKNITTVFMVSRNRSRASSNLRMSRG